MPLRQTWIASRIIRRWCIRNDGDLRSVVDGFHAAADRADTTNARLISFGSLELDGETYGRDVVIGHGQVRRRKKGPSKPYREQFGHTPLSVAEQIPWSAKQLIVGTGADGQLPVMDEVYEEAKRRGVKIVARPTAEACALLSKTPAKDVAAILHVTC